MRIGSQRQKKPKTGINIENLSSLFHSFHVENGLDFWHFDKLPEGIKRFYGEFHPPLVMYRQMAVGLPKIEVLDQEIMDVGMFGDASSAIGNIPEASFSQIVLVHRMIKAVKGIAAIMLVACHHAA